MKIYIFFLFFYAIDLARSLSDNNVSPDKFRYLESIAIKNLLRTPYSLKSIIINETVLSDMFDQLEISTLSNVLFNEINITELNEVLLEDHPHAHRNVIEIIELYEYKTETHHVETADGYILELHRITGNKTNPEAHNKPVVFLMHGILASSSDWVLTGPERGLAFLLADAGYDVWMGNARGNRYSRQHKTIQPNKKKFWQFSWHEIGIYDLPAMIDYVLNATGSNKLSYIGHSQGSTSFLVMLSECPEYNSKIKVMFSLAPVAYCSRMYSPFLQAISKIEKTLRFTISLTGPWEVLPDKGIIKTIMETICKGSMNDFCISFIFLLTGFNKEQFDMPLLPAILAHVPAGSSVYQLFHYAQMINSGHFRQFDHNYIGSADPPSYQLENIKIPVSLHYSNNDWLSDPEDVQKLYERLQNPINKSLVSDPKFNHLDFLYAKDIKNLLYDELMDILLQYQDVE